MMKLFKVLGAVLTLLALLPFTALGESFSVTPPTYDDGSWTPTLTFVTPGDLSVAYTTRVGAYIRNGNLVTLTGVVVTSTFTYTTASGNLEITGAPFTARTLTGYFAIGPLEFAGYTSATRPSVVASIGSASNILLFPASGTAVAQANVSTVQMPSAGSVVLAFTISYEI